MRLIDLLSEVPLLEVRGSTEVSCKGLSFDSREIESGMVFVAVKGTQVDGHQFIEKAVEKGAIAVITEKPIPAVLNPEMTWVRTGNTAKALGLMASNWHGRPSERLRLVGVTGTNGKTTTVTLLYQLFQGLGFKTGLISTVENRINTGQKVATHTTPDPLTLNALLAEMEEAGCEFAFMEVSSHAVVQERIAGLQFQGGVFTNLSHDHLDYHGSFRAYLEAKKKFFDELDTHAFALVNADDRNGQVMVQNTKASKQFYSLKQLATFRARILEDNLDGLKLEVDDQEVHFRLVGEFNAYNLICAYGVGMLLGQKREEVLRVLSSLTGAEGRFEVVRDPNAGRFGIVDYAHTPDALDKIMSTLFKARKNNSRIAVVVGCGGDRDSEKRPKMAAIAARADLTILTSDNPRTEDPVQILRDMEAGVPGDRKAHVLVNADRRQAIRTAVRWGRAGDIILVAGKGHEKYQEIQGKRLPFDDREELWKAFEEDK